MNYLEEPEYALGRRLLDVPLGAPLIRAKLAAVTKLRLEPARTAVLDSTTVRNAYKLVRDGLADGDDLEASTLPDLEALVFALVHFDHVVLFDHGALGDAVDFVRNLIGEDLFVVEWKTAGAPTGQYAFEQELVSVFDTINDAFRGHSEIHAGWRAAWGRVLDDPGIDLAYLERSFVSRMINSPKALLNVSTWTEDSLWPRTLAARDKNEPYMGAPSVTAYRSWTATYHTYRSLFYHAVAEHLGFVYLPCALRSVCAHIVPRLAFATATTDGDDTAERHRIARDLDAAISSSGAADSAALETRDVSRQPILHARPLLGAVLQRAAEATGARFGPSTKGKVLPYDEWTSVLRDLRDQSAGYRGYVGDVIEDCAGSGIGVEHPRSRLRRAARRVGPGVALSWAERFSLAGAAVGGAALVVLTSGTPGALKEAFAAATPLLSTPALYRGIANLREWRAVGRHVAFMHRAADAAREITSLDHILPRVFGRGLGPRERAYLEHLASPPSGAA